MQDIKEEQLVEAGPAD
jgi:hypothetical protein